MKIIFFAFLSSSVALAGISKKDVVNYKYEINTAPAALIANWYSLDFIKYETISNSDEFNNKFGYGFALVSYLRNNNGFDNTFPSRHGYAGGLVAISDSKDSYYGAHIFYEKYDRYTDIGSLIQEREGFRANLVVGGKEYFKRNFALKFGWGVEIQTYKVREYDEKNKFIQNNYTTVLLNPFYFELKLAGLF